MNKNTYTDKQQCNSVKEMIEILRLQQVPSDHLPELEFIKKELRQDLKKGDVTWFAIYCFNYGRIAGIREERKKIKEMNPNKFSVHLMQEKSHQESLCIKLSPVAKSERITLQAR